MHIILSNGFLILYNPFCHMVKFQLLARFPVVFLLLFSLLLSSFLLLVEFFASSLAGGHSSGLSDNKSPQISRTLLSILPDIINAVVWIVTTRPVISTSTRHFTNALVTVPRAAVTIGIIETFIFHHFLSKVEILILPFVFFQFYSIVRRNSKIHPSASSLFFH